MKFPDRKSIMFIGLMTTGILVVGPLIIGLMIALISLIISTGALGIVFSMYIILVVMFYSFLTLYLDS